MDGPSSASSEQTASAEINASEPFCTDKLISMNPTPDTPRHGERCQLKNAAQCLLHEVPAPIYFHDLHSQRNQSLEVGLRHLKTHVATNTHVAETDIRLPCPLRKLF